ncbi:MAG: type I polyketide synthase, partial [Myxococcota bacterium]
DTACSSSLVAIHQACTSLGRGESSLALAGGVNLLLSPDVSEVFAAAGMLSPDGRCRTFDAAASGYVRGEGCGLLVLKPLEQAQADGDRVLAVIRGSAVNQDGRSNGLTAPNGQAQEAVIRAALTRARLTPDDIDYVEAHGTGTELGDPIETEALGRVFGKRPSTGSPLRIGSVKTNIGHLEAAAGVAGLIKVVLALANRRLPGQLHFQAPNPHAPALSGETGLSVLKEAVSWPITAEGQRCAGVSSFGFGGTNAHLIVESPPATPPNSVAVAASNVDMARGLWLSERDDDALRALGQSAASALEGNHLTLDELVGEAARRARWPQRVAVVSDDAQGASQAMTAWVGGETAPKNVVFYAQRPTTSAPRVAFMFPGQAAQRTRMGAELYARSPIFRDRLDACDRVLREHIADFSLLELLNDSGPQAAQRLADTRFTQPALFAVEWSMAELFKARGVRPERLIGHSVGEYVAACIAGVFEWADALRLVARRAELVGGLDAGGAMLAVSLSADEAAQWAMGHTDVAVAVDNGAERSVLSGVRSTLESIALQLADRGVKTRWLDVSHAFHSPQLDPILPAFRDAVASTPRRSPRIDIIS